MLYFTVTVQPICLDVLLALCHCVIDVHCMHAEHVPLCLGSAATAAL